MTSVRMIHVCRETGLKYGRSLPVPTVPCFLRPWHLQGCSGLFGTLATPDLQIQTESTVQLVEDLKDRPGACAALGVAGKCIAQKMFRIKLWRHIVEKHRFIIKAKRQRTRRIDSNKWKKII